MGLDSLLKIEHQTLRVEIETISKCNSKCVHCPRDYLDQGRIMNEDIFERIMETYFTYRKTLELNRTLGIDRFPKFIFSGMGEPILNPLTPTFIRRLSDQGFRTKIYTNGSVLSPKRIEDLSKSGINEISVSFAGINQKEFQAITSGRYFEKSLRNILLLRDAAALNKINLYVTYNAFPQLISTDEEIKDFWANYGITCHGPYSIWNRAGLISLDQSRRALDVNRAINMKQELWCARLQFYDTITAKGDYIYCCCTFGHPKMISLGNIFTSKLGEIHRNYERILKEKDRLNICLTCEKPNETFFLDDLAQALEESKLRF